MCRLAAYLGPPITLQRFMLDPRHSLVVQAHAPAEMQTAALNADGFGVGWFNDDGRPAAYRSMAPAWADPNLPELGRSLCRGSWFANVRSATDPFSGGYSNTQPFVVDDLLFLHNGFITDFADGPRSAIRRWLRDTHERPIAGNTDSEYVFAVWRQLAADNGDDWLGAFRDLVELIDGWARGRQVLLNIIISDGRRLGFLRHALNAEPPSLYLGRDVPGFEGGTLIASEPMTDRHTWQALPAGEIRVMATDGSSETRQL
ncbi:class II glutamine amidotransferase [Ectothiorhodospiraceae bacterium WFHF3C12]|nr:class II glutamine amidotransferase [Ectothiorhodospiraceae bacterium WFHF3C12]